MRPPSMLPTTSDMYKDSYLRQHQNKLYKLQSFISTPDLTSDSSSGHTSESRRESAELQLLRPDVVQMHSFQVDPLSDKHQHKQLAIKPPPSMPVYQCHHHHQHNQSATNANLKPNEQKPRQNTTSPVTSTRF